jgi:hypothetical protein
MGTMELRPRPVLNSPEWPLLHKQAPPYPIDFLYLKINNILFLIIFTFIASIRQNIYATRTGLPRLWRLILGVASVHSLVGIEGNEKSI